MSKRFAITLITILFIVGAASVAVFLAKGYRFSSQTGTIKGTGILSVTSVPDQATVYLDDHLTTATNANINSLSPKSYTVKIIKEGFIPWEKKIDVKEGLVSEAKATLFRALPTIYPLTYTGAVNPVLSPDGQKLVFIVPESAGSTPATAKKSGIWVWTMSDRSIAFARGAEPHQIAAKVEGIDYTKATIKWSPDSTQVLLNFPDRYLLLEADVLNDQPKDITATLQATLKTWEEDLNDRNETRMETIKDLNLRKTASSAAVLKWSPDETKILYSTSGKDNFKVVDLINKKTYDLPQPKGSNPANMVNWLFDSLHLTIVDTEENKNPPAKSVPAINQKSGETEKANFLNSTVSIIEYDGFNKSAIYAGQLDPQSVFVWPDDSRIVISSAFPTTTTSQPNLFGINLK